jgi:hypothetical protein
MKTQFKPSDLSNFADIDLENFTLEEQKKLASFDPKEILYSSRQLAFRFKERMQKQWSNLLMVYLVIFTISMFTTLWFSGQCGVLWIEKFCISHLSDTTLNFLITVGFAKVIGVVWIIVRHLFPTTK